MTIIENEINDKFKWDVLVCHANNTRKELDGKPDVFKVGYFACPGGILNAYREGDLNFKEAVSAIEKITSEALSANNEKWEARIKELEELIPTKEEAEKYIKFLKEESAILYADLEWANRVLANKDNKAWFIEQKQGEITNNEKNVAKLQKIINKR